ncbi:hypothetical protein HPP92_003087 [Vanilla planifolia]|uniref:Protein kinase domain-containing protein n=1 Tax=Vanilla planifolia TaxID=51239 RepID=A0A835RU77_VANPL|nr:hypothetical protein HPP92_003087 [Vanilla planifolia]
MVAVLDLFPLSSEKMPTSRYLILLPLLASILSLTESTCSRGCELALASYYVSPNTTLSHVSSIFGNASYGDILQYNHGIIDGGSILTGSRINISFPCDCINGDFLGRTFSYLTVGEENYDRIAGYDYANLSNSDVLSLLNRYPPTGMPSGSKVNVAVTCFCGDESVSKDYGLFVTYPLRGEDSLRSLAAGYGFLGKEDLLQRYNPGKNFSAGKGVVFIPTKDLSGSYKSSHFKKRNQVALPVSQPENVSNIHYGIPVLTPLGGFSDPLIGIAIDKSMEFSYEELAKATNNFDVANKIGEGGFGAVYYAELRGEKAAIKKMDMEASREFCAELKVLTHVHHSNLLHQTNPFVITNMNNIIPLLKVLSNVKMSWFQSFASSDGAPHWVLYGGSLFLVYEYIENGNLKQHLRGSKGRDPLPWSARVQIALDSARGLEYIHEHTVQLYIHRDIKSDNILIDNNLHGKVSDFGLAKLAEVRSTSLQTRLVGTFGYMPPEYAKYGDVSPKVDVYAFGVVLYELISAKEAIIKTNGSSNDTKKPGNLGALKHQDPRDELRTLVDVRLGDSYPIESIIKMAQLARACTHENPQLRPSMRSIMVALMTLSSSSEELDMGSLYDNEALENFISGS